MMRVLIGFTLCSVAPLASATSIRLYTTFFTDDTKFLCGSTTAGLTECRAQANANITTFQLEESIGSITLVEDTTAGAVNHTLGLKQDTSSFPLASFIGALEPVFFSMNENSQLTALLENKPVAFYAAQNVTSGWLYTIGGVVGNISQFEVSGAENLQQVSITVQVV